MDTGGEEDLCLFWEWVSEYFGSYWKCVPYWALIWCVTMGDRSDGSGPKSVDITLVCLSIGLAIRVVRT